MERLTANPHPLDAAARDELARKATAASRGPWRAATTPHPEAVRLRTEAASVYAPDHLIYTSARDYDCLPETWEQQRANADFIAACSPDVILALLAAAQRGEELAEGVRHAMREGAIIGVHHTRLPEMAERFDDAARSATPTEGDDR